MAVALLVAAGALAQESEPRLRTHARAVVVGDDGRIVELVGEGGAGFRFRAKPGAAREEPRGATVLLDQLGLGRGWLGVQLVALTEQLRERFGVPPGEGALVSDVVADSPAERAGLRAGDVITAVGSQPVRRTGDVSLLVAERDGESVELEVFRDRAPMLLSAAIAERSRPLVKIARDGDAVLVEWIGAGEGPPLRDARGARFLVDDALEGLGLYFASDEWRERAAGAATGDPAPVDAEQIQRRIEALERQIDELRGRLGDGFPPR